MFQKAEAECHSASINFLHCNNYWVTLIYGTMVAVFMLFVAIRYYQQTMVVEEWVEEDGGGADDLWQGNVGGQRQGQGRGRGPTILETPKVKKGS